MLSLALGLLLLLGGVALYFVIGGENGRLSLLVGSTLFPLIARHAIGGVFLGQGRIAHYSFALYGQGYLAFAFLVVWMLFLGNRSVEDALGAWIAAQYAALFVSCLFVPTWWKRLLDRPGLGC